MKKINENLKDEIISKISHDIRTPLNAINGYAEILLQTDEIVEKDFLSRKIAELSSDLVHILDNLVVHSFVSYSLSGAVQLQFPYDIELSGKKILLVEDLIDNQKILNYFLSKSGAYIDFATNGIMAIEKVQKSNYDVILMDIQMPIMDGYEATKKIRSIGYDNLIIALTANDTNQLKSNFRSQGFNGLISKPVTQHSLIKKLLYILKHESTESFSSKRSTGMRLA